MKNPGHVPLQHPSTDDLVLSDWVVTLVTSCRCDWSAFVEYGVEPTGPNRTRTIGIARARELGICMTLFVQISCCERVAAPAFVRVRMLPLGLGCSNDA